jgi:hypothetical protein
MRIADHRARVFCCIVIASMSTAVAEQADSPTPGSSPTVAPTPAIAPAPTRSVRISFVPPPLEGTISLGVYDLSGKLVRVLHQQEPLEVFTIGADSLQTKWDGKDDDGFDLPAGKYRAHGYLVGSLQIEKLEPQLDATPPPPSASNVTIKLTANPLVKNDRPNAELTVRFDDTDSFIATADELPLYIISERPGITAIAAAKNADKSIDVWQESGAGREHFRISKLDQMMAFDCGAFDLK